MSQYVLRYGVLLGFRSEKAGLNPDWRLQNNSRFSQCFFFSSNFSILFLYFRTEIKSLNWGKGPPTNWNRAVAIKISKAHQLKLTCRQFSSDLNNFRKSKKRKNNHRTILQINLATTLTGLLQENFLAKKTRAPHATFLCFSLSQTCF